MILECIGLDPSSPILFCTAYGVHHTERQSYRAAIYASQVQEIMHIKRAWVDPPPLISELWLTDPVDSFLQNFGP